MYVVWVDQWSIRMRSLYMHMREPRPLSCRWLKSSLRLGLQWYSSVTSVYSDWRIVDLLVRIDIQIFRAESRVSDWHVSDVTVNADLSRSIRTSEHRCTMLAQPVATPQRGRGLLQLLPVLIITSSLITLVATQNIDTEKPILREVNGLANGSLFGYSLVLHQTLSNLSNMAEAISGAR